MDVFIFTRGVIIYVIIFAYYYFWYLFFFHYLLFFFAFHLLVWSFLQPQNFIIFVIGFWCFFVILLYRAGCTHTVRPYTRTESPVISLLLKTEAVVLDNWTELHLSENSSQLESDLDSSLTCGWQSYNSEQTASYRQWCIPPSHHGSIFLRKMPLLLNKCTKSFLQSIKNLFHVRHICKRTYNTHNTYLPIFFVNFNTWLCILIHTYF